MMLYPLSVHAQINPSLPSTVARHEATQLAQRLNVAVTWDDQRVTPLDVCSSDCLVCYSGEPSQNLCKAPIEAVSGWETTGV